jgi:hypothetical protein
VRRPPDLVRDERDAIETRPRPLSEHLDPGRVFRSRLSTLERALNVLDRVAPGPEPVHPRDELRAEPREIGIAVEPDPGEGEGEESETSDDEGSAFQPRDVSVPAEI